MATVKEVITDAITKVAAKFHGEIVDNLASTNSKLPLSAAQGKALKEYVNKIAYPVGSIFIWNHLELDEGGSTFIVSEDLTTAAKVKQYFGFGEWIQLKPNMFLRSQESGNPDEYVNYKGGSSTVTLTTGNLPSHTHSIPSLSGSTGKKTLTGNIYNMAAQSSKSGVDGNGICSLKDETGSSVGYAVNSKTSTSTYGDNIVINVSHEHLITTIASTSGKTGSGTAFSILPPYYNVYMYQRIS